MAATRLPGKIQTPVMSGTCRIPYPPPFPTKDQAVPGESAPVTPGIAGELELVA